MAEVKVVGGASDGALGTVALSAQDDGSTNLQFRDLPPGGKNAKSPLGFLRVGIDADHKPSLKLGELSSSFTENTRAVLGCTSLEKTRTGAVEETAPSSLVLFDKEGKVIFKAPE